MEEVNTVILENGLEYIEVDELIYNDTKYILLSNYENIKDSCIRKIVIKDKQEYFSKINDDDEYKNVLKLFLEKNKALF